MTPDTSGPRSPDSFAYYDPASSSVKTSQGTLLSDSTESSPTLPKWGWMSGGELYELPTSAPPTDANASSSLLPTPNADESTPTDEYIEEMLQAGVRGDERLYLPDRKWHSQRTLSRIAPALLPTPSAVQNDGHDPEIFLSRRERERAKGRNGNGFGLTLGMSVALLPTPTGDDANNVTRESGEYQSLNRAVTSHLLPTPTAEDGERGAGADAAREGGPTLRGALLPTPTVQDAANTAGPSQHDRNSEALNVVAAKLLPTPTAGDAKSSGSRNLEGSEAHAGVSLTDIFRTGGSTESRTPLLPTPVANPDNPGAGGELRAALTHGPGRRNETGIDSMGRPNEGRPSRLLPTPQASDGDGGRQDRNPETLATGRRPSGTKASVPLATAVDQLLPTPKVSANRSGRRAMTGIAQWSSVALEQAAEIAAGILPREFESWDEVPGSIGESMRQRSADGNTPSDEQPPGQLTIADA